MDLKKENEMLKEQVENLQKEAAAAKPRGLVVNRARDQRVEQQRKFMETTFPKGSIFRTRTRIFTEKGQFIPAGTTFPPLRESGPPPSDNCELVRPGGESMEDTMSGLQSTKASRPEGA